MAVKKDEEAYTSPSTAENQNESEKVYAKAPTKPLPMMVNIFDWFSSPDFFATLSASAVMVQKRKRMVKALIIADILFTICAMCALSEANNEKNLPIKLKSGAPGGWPTSNLYAVEIYSPQSQKLAVGSMVERYVNAATAKTAQPVMLLIR